jgi:sugar lactone lactonase YvrE
MRERHSTWLIAAGLALVSCGDDEAAAALDASGEMASTADGGADDAAASRDILLPGDDFYPEGIALGDDDSLYIGSFGTGAIVRVMAGGSAPSPLVAPSSPMKRTLGLRVDDREQLLYACANESTEAQPTAPTVDAYALADGSRVGSHGFPTLGFCNDLVFSPAHDLYVSDSSGKIYRLADGDELLRVWSDDPLLASPQPANGFGANGLAVDGATLYVDNFDDGRLLAIPIGSDGSAGAAREIALDPPLDGPDGMTRVREGELLVVEQLAGRLRRVLVPSGESQIVAGGLVTPTAVVVVEDDWFVVEGQLGHLLGTLPGLPNLPFRVRRLRQREQAPVSGAGARFRARKRPR